MDKNEILEALKGLGLIIVNEEKYEHLIETQLKFTMLLDRILSSAELTTARDGLFFQSKDVANAIETIVPQLYDVYYTLLLEDRTGLS